MSCLSERKTELDQIVHNAQKEITDRQKSLRTLKIHIKKLAEERKLLKEQIETQKPIVKKAEPNKEIIKELINKVNHLKTEYEAAIETSRDKKEAVHKLNKKSKKLAEIK